MTVGIAIGLSAGVGGILGTIIGGRIADKRGATNKKWYLYVPMLAAILTLIPASVMYFSDNTNLVLGAILPTTLLSSLGFGAVFAVGQSLAKPNMRAMSTAILLLFSKSIGLALGPLITGMLSDYFMPTFGNLSLRYAIIASGFALALAAYLFWLASKHYEADLVLNT